MRVLNGSFDTAWCVMLRPLYPDDSNSTIFNATWNDWCCVVEGRTAELESLAEEVTAVVVQFLRHLFCNERLAVLVRHEGDEEEDALALIPKFDPAVEAHLPPFGGSNVRPRPPSAVWVFHAMQSSHPLQLHERLGSSSSILSDNLGQWLLATMRLRERLRMQCVPTWPRGLACGVSPIRRRVSDGENSMECTLTTEAALLD